MLPHWGSKDLELGTVRAAVRDLGIGWEQLDALARTTGRSKSELASEALAAYIAAHEWQVDAIREGLHAADAGAEPVEHAAVAAWLRSWGTEAERPRPR